MVALYVYFMHVIDILLYCLNYANLCYRNETINFVLLTLFGKIKSFSSKITVISEFCTNEGDNFRRMLANNFIANFLRNNGLQRQPVRYSTFYQR